jgi:predicted DNA-binding protein (MmcQ/YjbR family)
MENVLARPQVSRRAMPDLLEAQPVDAWRAKAQRLDACSLGMPARALTRLRKLCLALPEAHEVEAWGEPTFRVRNKIFAMYANASNHHGGGRHAVWCKALHVNQELLVRSAPDRFFVPPYVGPSGWVGVYLDGSCVWTELTDIVRDSYRLIAPKKLAAALGPD